ncbi:MAG: hypothetical protein GY904_08730 [Planctomycetaceae bacterium]|nr:hypothetical protein [Planctomycetaceae bacterium]
MKKEGAGEKRGARWNHVPVGENVAFESPIVLRQLTEPNRSIKAKSRSNEFHFVSIYLGLHHGDSASEKWFGKQQDAGERWLRIG